MNPDAPANPSWVWGALFFLVLAIAVAAYYWFAWWRDTGYWRRRRR